jgi:hypothetical protein
MRTQFWKQISKLRQLPKGNLATKQQLSDLYDVIETVFGEREASEFVKICASLKSSELSRIALAVKDLDQNNWFFDETVNNCKDKKVSKSKGGFTLTKVYSDADFGYNYGNMRGYRSVGPATTSRSEPRYKRNLCIDTMSQDMRSFLLENFTYLEQSQKSQLRTLPIRISQPTSEL